MRKILPIILILLVSVINKVSPQENLSWQKIALFSNETAYQPTAIFFPEKFNDQPENGYLEGVIIAEKTDDETGAIFYTQDGGINWEKIDRLNDDEWEPTVIFGGLTGWGYTLDRGNYTDRIYTWGKKGTLLRGTSTSYWEKVPLPTELEDKEIIWCAFSQEDPDFAIITDGTDFWKTSDISNWQGPGWTKAQPVKDSEGQEVTVAGINQIVYHTGGTYFIGDNDPLVEYNETFYALGKGGQIIKTTDGINWTLVNENPHRGPYDGPDEIVNKELNVEFTSGVSRVGEYYNTGSDRNRYFFLSAIDTQTGHTLFYSSIEGANTGSAIHGIEYQTQTGAFGPFTYIINNSTYYTVSEQGQIVISDNQGNDWSTLQEAIGEKVAFTVTPQTVMYMAKKDGSVNIYVPELTPKFTSEQSETARNEFDFINQSSGFITSYKWEFESANPPTSDQLDVYSVKFSKEGTLNVTLTVSGTIPGQTKPTEKSVTETVRVRESYDWDAIYTSTGGNITKIVFPEGQTAIGFITIDTPNEIWKTYDGGRTWENKLTSFRPDPDDEEQKDLEPVIVYRLLGMTFPSMQVGYACGYGPDSFSDEGMIYNPQIWKTTDAGESWQELDMSEFDGIFTAPWEPVNNFEPDYYDDIQFRDENNGVVINKGFILVTKDGGENWQLATVASDTWKGSQEPLNVNKVYYADESTLYAVGSLPPLSEYSPLVPTRQVYKSVDGGETWNLIYTDNLDEKAYFSTVAFHNPDEGYVFRKNEESVSEIYITEDGGENWKVIPLGNNSVIKGVNLTDDSSIIICGTEETLMTSTDNGENWTNESQAIIGITLNDVTSTAMGTLFAAGSNGFIKRYLPELVASFEMIVDEDSTKAVFRNTSYGLVTDYEWKVNGQVVSREYNAPELELNRDNSYRITLTITGEEPKTGETVSKEMTKTIWDMTSISNNTFDADVSIYPNPVSDILNYSFSLTETTDIKILVSTVNGSEFLCKEFNKLNAGKYQYSENTSSWQPGIYLFRLVMDNKVVKTIKVVK